MLFYFLREEGVNSKFYLHLEFIYLYFPPSSQLVYVMFLSCRPFVVITTLSTGLVGVEITINCPSQETEVTSTPTRPVDNVLITTKGLQDRNITYNSWDDGGK